MSTEGDSRKARSFARRSLKHSGPEESHLRKALRALLVCGQTQLGRRDDALATCPAREGLFSRGTRKFDSAKVFSFMASWVD